MLHNSSEVIKKLVWERQRQNMTQQEISDIIGVLLSNLARFESGSWIFTLGVWGQTRAPSNNKSH